MPAAIRPEVAACLRSACCGVEGLAGPDEAVAAEGFAAAAALPDALVEAVEPKAGFEAAAAAEEALAPYAVVAGLASAFGGTAAGETDSCGLPAGLSAFGAAGAESVLPTFGSGSRGDFFGWSQTGAGSAAVAAGFVSSALGSALAAGVWSLGLSSVLAASPSAEIAFTSFASRSIVTGSALDLEWRGGFPDTMTTSFLPAIL
ncbi:hypothetical protein AGRO_0919 [Agrobacterium sp. ATCC 31749]|nr:hypothetical protein AGRO_0919 [Agrobacterium sp. ATCC 31749]